MVMEPCHIEEPDQSRQWPLSPCPGCGAMEVEECECEENKMFALPGNPSDAGAEPMRRDPVEPPPTWFDYACYADQEISDAKSHRTDRDTVRAAKLARIACFERAVEHLADAIKELRSGLIPPAHLDIHAGNAAYWAQEWTLFFNYPDRVHVERLRMVDAA